MKKFKFIFQHAFSDKITQEEESTGRNKQEAYFNLMGKLDMNPNYMGRFTENFNLIETVEL